MDGGCGNTDTDNTHQVAVGWGTIEPNTAHQVVVGWGNTYPDTAQVGGLVNTYPDTAHKVADGWASIEINTAHQGVVVCVNTVPNEMMHTKWLVVGVILTQILHTKWLMIVVILAQLMIGGKTKKKLSISYDPETFIEMIKITIAAFTQSLGLKNSAALALLERFSRLSVLTFNLSTVSLSWLFLMSSRLSVMSLPGVFVLTPMFGVTLVATFLVGVCEGVFFPIILGVGVPLFLPAGLGV